MVAEALGADVVMVGRPPLLALAAEGEQGVSAVLSALTADYTESRRLLGATSHGDVNADLVRLRNQL
jgi:isopentenyl diphosphate isomerase/L-lactate dehydrogenase-like FMN-dependent dehydrogenase